MRLKVAFHAMGGEDWPVGPIYLRNLFYALRQTYGKEIRLCLLAPAGHFSVEDYARSVEAEDLVLYDTPKPRTVPWLLNGVLKRGLLRDMAMERSLKQHQINIVFGLTILHRYTKIATLSWLPDFQHVHLPGMFSHEGCLSRDRTFLNSAKTSTRVILMSEAVKKDFELFAPLYAHKARVLHPISYVPPSIYELDLDSILSLYGLPEKFFLSAESILETQKPMKGCFRLLKFSRIKEFGSFWFVLVTL
jgi:hypothetical protein